MPARQAVQNRIDPSQIPRPLPQAGGEPLVFETRVNGAHAAPPPSCSRYVVRDTGSCGPRYMRATMNQVRTCRAQRLYALHRLSTGTCALFAVHMTT